MLKTENTLSPYQTSREQDVKKCQGILNEPEKWEFLSFPKGPKAHKSVQRVRRFTAFTAGKTVNVDKWVLFLSPLKSITESEKTLSSSLLQWVYTITTAAETPTYWRDNQHLHHLCFWMVLCCKRRLVQNCIMCIDTATGSHFSRPVCWMWIRACTLLCVISRYRLCNIILNLNTILIFTERSV